MPGFDGTGPMGQGPMTGGGRGYCAVPLSGNRPMYPGRRFFGRGGGRGRRNWYYATGLTGWQRASMGMPAFGEVDILKNEADVLKKQLEDIQSRIETLEKVQAEKSE